MTTAHTQGPWTLRKRHSMHAWEIVGPNNENIGETSQWLTTDDPWESKCNALLIACAPELLDCLNYCLGILESIPTQTLAAIEDENLDECVDFHRIRGVLLKAQGEHHES